MELSGNPSTSCCLTSDAGQRSHPLSMCDTRVYTPSPAQNHRSPSENEDHRANLWKIYFARAYTSGEDILETIWRPQTHTFCPFPITITKTELAQFLVFSVQCKRYSLGSDVLKTFYLIHCVVFKL